MSTRPKKRRKTIPQMRNVVLWAAPAVGLTLLALGLSAAYLLVRRTLSSVEPPTQESLPREAEQRLEALLRGALTDVLDLVAVSAPDEQRRGFEEMERLAAASQFFADLTLYDKLGEVVFSTTSDAESAEKYREIFELVLAGSPAVSPFAGDARSSGGQSVQIFVPVFEDNGETHQVMVGTVPLDRIWSIIEAAGSPEDFDAAFMRAYGHLLSDTNAERTVESSAAEVERLTPATESDTSRGGHFYAAQRFAAADAHAAAEFQFDAFRKAATLVAWVTAATFAVATLVIAIMGLAFYRMIRRVQGPLKQTAAAARDIAKGDLHVTVSEEGPEEIGHIAKAFNHLLAELRYHRHTFSKMVKSRTRKLESAHKDLEQNLAQLRASYDSSRDAVLLVDAAHETVVESNQQIVRLFGIPTTQAGTFTVDAFRKAAGARFGEGAEFERQWNHYRSKPGAEGREEWRLSAPIETILEVYTSPVRQVNGRDYIGRLWTFRDITEQRRLEEKLRQAQKIDTIEHVAASFAHDFNNLLTVILGNLSICVAELGKDEKIGSHLIEAEQATLQATNRVKQLLGFSDRSRMNIEQVQLNQILDQVVRIVNDTTPPHIVVKSDFDDTAWAVPADAEQIKQVLMNLFMNSVDAMPTGGTLWVRAGNVIVQRGEAGLPSNLEAGDYVCITIEDSGSGMPDHVRERVFEPFFTTKSEHGGQGLGLSVAESVVTKHGGWITCASTPDEGTQFKMYLQRSKKRSKSMTMPQAANQGTSKPPLILIVDDEAGVRRIASSVLARFSIESIEAADGEEAVKIYEQRMNDISVVLLDMSMPKLSGRDTFVALKAMNPDVQVLLCSGYPVDLGEFQEMTGHRPQGTVQKPFDMAGLAKAVRDVISSRTESSPV